MGVLKNITVAQQVVLKEMCETPVLLSTQAAGLIEVILYQKVANCHA